MMRILLFFTLIMLYVWPGEVCCVFECSWLDCFTKTQETETQFIKDFQKIFYRPHPFNNTVNLHIIIMSITHSTT